MHTPSVTAPITLQPKPASRAQPEEEDDSEVRYNTTNLFDGQGMPALVEIMSQMKIFQN